MIDRPDDVPVLPCGIDEIEIHLAKFDDVPLRVPLFCDVTEKTTEQMFEIYQNNGDIVACIGNVLNPENLHTF